MTVRDRISREGTGKTWGENPTLSTICRDIKGEKVDNGSKDGV